MKTALLVNPWIYDFAAHDYGMRPLGLLRIGEHLRRQGKNVVLVDCVSEAAGKRDPRGFSKIKKIHVNKPALLKQTARPYFRYGISIGDFTARLENIRDVETIYVASGMTYWYPGVQLAIELLRRRFGGIPIILGGIYATLCNEHAKEFSGADIVWKGDYLTREHFLDVEFSPAYDLLTDCRVLPIQLTRGCPFSCSYCASNILAPSFTMKDPVHLFEEVMRAYRYLGAKVFVFYDDAVMHKSTNGIKTFLRMMAASGAQCVFQTPNGIHAKYVDEELAILLKKANFKNVRLSLETADESLQEFTGNKVTNNDLKRALRNLKEAGFDKEDLGVYLLIGAPWLTIERTLEDIIFVNSLGAQAILASYSPIPGTRDFSVMAEKGIIEKDLDPLWHNNTIFPELLDPTHPDRIRLIRSLTSKLNRM
ncbi:MAG: radical SAM protein [Candidatus Omnitrophota bacterium]